MKAIILAGGKGTRLGDSTKEIPKPMVVIGNKSVLEHQIELLVRYGFNDIIILVNYLKELIIDNFGDGKKYNANIQYFEEPAPLGTVGGIKEIEDHLTDDFLILYGDVMMDMNLNRLKDFHFKNSSQCTLVLHPNDHPYDSDLVETDLNDRIISFHNKPHHKELLYRNLVNAGVYIFSPEILKYLEKGKKADFGKDIFPHLYDKIRMYGYHTPEYLKDMGTPDRLMKVREDLKSGKIKRSNIENKQPAIFLDRDGVINIEQSYISKPEQLELYDFTPLAIKKINKAGYISVVVTNQSAIARNLCTEEDVQNIHKKLETILGNNEAWLDAIYYCPHHPDKGFPEENPIYKIDCDCRKPGIGMFKKAIEKFNIDTSVSFMIGDTERDIQAGINAGCNTIGVRTGYGMKKTNVYPDYMFENLAEAVDFIVDDPYRELFLEIKKLYENSVKPSPWKILIGGNTRSGKSTMTSYLKIAFERSGKRVLIISLDNWLLPSEKRDNNMNVYDRFQLRTIEYDINEILNGKKLTIDSYANNNVLNSHKIEYHAVNFDIIIIEGVVALSSEKVRSIADLKIFLSVEHNEFVKRINEYYNWRGYTKTEIMQLVNKREKDEYQLIEKESNLADMIINSSVS